jgi:hypothetical protein
VIEAMGRLAAAAGLAALLVGATVAAPSTARGEAANETEPVRLEECRTEEEYGTVCVRTRGVEHSTTQPDGDQLFVFNLVTDFSLTLEDGRTTETNQSVHDRVVFREGEEHVVSRTAASRYTMVDGKACRYHAVFVVTGGELRVDDVGVSCTEP